MGSKILVGSSYTHTVIFNDDDYVYIVSYKIMSALNMHFIKEVIIHWIFFYNRYGSRA